jgi:Ca2+-transporting ATPase
VDADHLVAISERLAAGGLRVLALGMPRWTALPDAVTPEVVECDLTLLGLVGLVDPPREEAREAVVLCQSAGIVPVVIASDHPVTARALAKRLGMLGDGEVVLVLTGAAVARLSAEEPRAWVEYVRVYARVAPEQKLHIVTAVQAQGKVVAMTGDGVNDAPALRGGRTPSQSKPPEDDMGAGPGRLPSH